MSYMKKILKNIIFFLLYLEARLMLFRYSPRIIAISGTVGKTSTKDMIYHVMKDRFNVRKTQKSLNSEIGIPLTILGLKSGWNSPVSWLKILVKGFFRIIYTPNYPNWLVIETGVDKKGDMDMIAKWLKPEIVVITAFGSIPAHVENFDSPEDVMKEEGKLMEYVREGGSIILNADDPDILKLKSNAAEKTYTYGIMNEESDVLATHECITYAGIPTGMSFKVEYEGNTVPVQINGVLGKQFIYPSLASITVGKILGISPAYSSNVIREFKASPGRMNILEGKNGSIVIDDSYNASPIAMHKAVEVLGEVKGGVKVAVLGDILEIGRYAKSEHEKIGKMVDDLNIDYLVTVGERGEYIADGAKEAGMLESRIFSFNTSTEAISKVQSLQEEGSVILVKGSQGMRMEKISKEIIENSQYSGNLLVRQEKEWRDR